MKRRLTDLLDVLVAVAMLMKLMVLDGFFSCSSQNFLRVACHRCLSESEHLSIEFLLRCISMPPSGIIIAISKHVNLQSGCEKIDKANVAKFIAGDLP